MEILGSVLLVAIILGSITAAYLWGLPLINKSGDSNRMDYTKTIFEKLSDSFSKVAREGGQSSMDVQIDRGVFRLERDQANEYVLTYTMQSDLKFFSATEVPINDFNSPYVTKEGWVKATAGACSTPIGGLTCDKTGTLDLGGDGSYPVCLCVGDVLNYNAVQYRTGDTFGATKYTLRYINYVSGAAQATGGFETVVGLLGVDKAGVILAKAKPVGNVFEITMKLKPRKLFDPSNNEILELNLAGARGASTVGRGTFSISMKNAGETVRTEQVTIEGKAGSRKVRSVTIEVSFST